METYLLDWGNLLLRWLHVITAIAWIGSSFYFVFLDNSLTPPEDEDLKARGVDGELWAVHGGGFYNPQKYLVGPKRMPRGHLHWFYWESYSTWISGFALFSLLYLWNAQSFLVDKKVFDWSPVAAGVSAVGFLVAGWVIYDFICRVFGKTADSRIGNDARVLVMVFGMVVAASWLACHLFAGRAAFLVVGAMLATMMSANVFFWIIPGQRKVVAQLKAGEKPDPIHGQRGKQRSVHNTYFTLPVLIAMLSNHYSMVYEAQHNWVVLVALMFAGTLIRQFFVMRHKGRQQWGYPLAAIAILTGLIIWLKPAPQAPAPATAQAAPISFAQAHDVLQQRCVMCHNAALANKNVRLDEPALIAANAQKILQFAVLQKTMPLNNATGITDAERTLLGEWVRQGAKTSDTP